MKCSIEIYQSVTGNWCLDNRGNGGKGVRWPSSVLGPTDGFATREEAEQHKIKIESGLVESNSKRVPVGFSPLG